MLAISIDPIEPVKCITELLESLKKAVADKNEGAITLLRIKPLKIEPMNASTRADVLGADLAKSLAYLDDYSHAALENFEHLREGLYRLQSLAASVLVGVDAKA